MADVTDILLREEERVGSSPTAPSRPSKSRVKVKTLERLETVA
jgi:hypothetical protein